MPQSSLCFQKAELPRIFHCCTSTPSANCPNCYVQNEIRTVIASNFPAPGAHFIAIGTILGRIQQAEQGNLDEDDSDPVHKIVSEPDIWEIRWTLRGAPYRLYYAEELNRKPKFIALKFTKKWVDGSDEEIRAHQNGDAKIAQERFENASKYHWGHDTDSKRCKFCFNNNPSNWL